MDFTTLYTAMQQKAKKPNYEDSLNKVINILVKALNTIHGVEDSYVSFKIKRISQADLKAIEFYCNGEFNLGIIIKNNGEVLVDLEPENKEAEPIDVKEEDRTPITKAVEQIIEGSDNFEDVKGAFAKEDDNDEFKDTIVRIINTLEDLPFTSKFDDLHVYGIDNHLGFFDGKNFVISLIFKNDEVICCKDITSKIGDGIKLTGVTKALAEKVRSTVENKKDSNKHIRILSEREALRAAADMLADLMRNKLF